MIPATGWSIRRHRRRPERFGPRHAVATGLAVAGMLATGVWVADTLGLRSVPAHAVTVSEWLPPPHVGALPAASGTPGAAPSAPAGTAKTGTPTGPPTFLKIPSISVSTTLEQLRIGSGGALDPPGFDDAGWYAGGTAPGDVGPAVIAGHYDTVDRPAIFYQLKDLRAGDLVQVQRGGQWLTFTVTGIATYPKRAFPTAVVYGPTPTPQLRLITCGGTFDRSRRSYDDNVIVFATETS